VGFPNARAHAFFFTVISHDLLQSSLLGFYDPCPGEPKQLLVVYEFRGQQHRGVVGDDKPFAAPLKCEFLIFVSLEA
jgi:hypothetical protein